MQKSKIDRLQKSRESRFLGFSSAARRFLQRVRRFVVAIATNDVVPHVVARVTLRQKPRHSLKRGWDRCRVVWP
jgi:hypothetical protein